MQIEISQDAEQWARHVVREGRFDTVEDAIAFAVDQAKLHDLRKKIAESEKAGGAHSADEAIAYVKKHLAG